MRNLHNFRQAVERPKSWNSISCICLKTTFFYLKHYIQKILSNITFNYLCGNSPNSLCHFWNHNSFFHYSTCLYYFRSNVTYCWKKYPIIVQVFRFFTAQVKIHQISHVIFQTKSEFFFKLWITVQCHER